MIEAASSAAPPLQLLNKLSAPRWLFRTVACLILGGQVIARICKGRSVDVVQCVSSSVQVHAASCLLQPAAGTCGTGILPPPLGVIGCVLLVNDAPHMH